MKRLTIVILSLMPTLIAAEPSQDWAIRERAIACQGSSQMNLWHISSESPLIRSEMLDRNHCWRALAGMKVTLVRRIGEFSHVQHSDGRFEFFVYTKDLKKWAPPSARAEAGALDTRRSVSRLAKIENTSEFGVTLLHKRPTVTIILAAGDDLTVEFTVVKEAIRAGYHRRITDQTDTDLTVGGSHGKFHLGLGSNGTYAEIRFLNVDQSKRIAEVQVEASLGLPGSRPVHLRSSRVKISGRNFDELLRPHTPAELSKVLNWPNE